MGNRGQPESNTQLMLHSPSAAATNSYDFLLACSQEGQEIPSDTARWR